MVFLIPLTPDPRHGPAFELITSLLVQLPPNIIYKPPHTSDLDCDIPHECH